VACGAGAFPQTSLWAHLLNELGGLPESGEIQQWQLGRKLLGKSRVAVIGPAQGDGGAGAVRQAEDDVGLSPAAHPDDCAALPAQGVMRMENRDESQRGLGYRGSVLGICRRCSTGFSSRPS
jgi:hypothetical protein